MWTCGIVGTLLFAFSFGNIIINAFFICTRKYRTSSKYRPRICGRCNDRLQYSCYKLKKNYYCILRVVMLQNDSSVK